MKGFIKRKLRENLERDSHVVGSATDDKFKLSEYDDYDDFDEFDEFDDVLDMPSEKPVKKVNGTIKAFHGTPNKIGQFSDEFVGGKEANDQEGPGIYFTTKSDEALKYAAGGFVYEVDLKVKNLVSDEKAYDLEYLIEPVTKLIKMASNWKAIAKGYDDGIEEMVGRYISMAQSEKEVFVTLYYDVYREEPVAYVKNMVKLGYDGVYLPAKGDDAHIVIYNPSTIHVTNAKRVI